MLATFIFKSNLYTSFIKTKALAFKLKLL